MLTCSGFFKFLDARSYGTTTSTAMAIIAWSADPAPTFEWSSVPHYGTHTFYSLIFCWYRRGVVRLCRRAGRSNTTEPGLGLQASRDKWVDKCCLPVLSSVTFPLYLLGPLALCWSEWHCWAEIYFLNPEKSPCQLWICQNRKRRPPRWQQSSISWRTTQLWSPTQGILKVNFIIGPGLDLVYSPLMALYNISIL